MSASRSQAARTFPIFRPRHRRRLYLLGQILLGLYFGSRAVLMVTRHQVNLPFSSTALEPATSAWSYALLALWVVGAIATMVAATAEIVKIVQSRRRLARRHLAASTGN